MTACGLGGNSPSDVAKNFYRSIEAGKNSDAHLLISKQSKNKYGETSTAAKAYADRIEDKRTRKWAIKSITLIDEITTNEGNKIEIKIQYGSDFIDEDRLEMVNEDGKWRIKSSMLLDKLIAKQ